MGGYQNCGPFLCTLSLRCRVIIGIPKGTIILTTTPVAQKLGKVYYRYLGFRGIISILKY